MCLNPSHSWQKILGKYFASLEPSVTLNALDKTIFEALLSTLLNEISLILFCCSHLPFETCRVCSKFVLCSILLSHFRVFSVLCGKVVSLSLVH